MTGSGFEMFLSYSRRDNGVPKVAPPDAKRWVTALHDHILEDHSRFSTEPLQIFFDNCPATGIPVMDDWWHRILDGLKHSTILLVCLSLNYFRSKYCRWEWEGYIRRLHERLGVGTIGVVTAVHGLGGQRKTELAVAYAHGIADCDPAGLWVLGAEGVAALLILDNVAELAVRQSCSL